MASKFEIGQKVLWRIKGFVLRGLFLDEKDSEFSTIQCYEKDGLPYVSKIDVVTNILEKDGDN